MEYHKDRFEDHSLLVYKEQKLVAVLPANRVGDTLYSHQGLTYGGLVVQNKLNFNTYLQIVKTLLQWINKDGFKELHLKEVPSFYCTNPSGEFNYILFLLQATCYRVDLAMVIDSSKSSTLSRVRKRGVQRAKNAKLEIREVTDFTSFWDEVLVPNRMNLYGVAPTHKLEEIAYLHHKFDQNIRQFNCYYNDKVVAGATLFITKTSVHVQYAAANEQRQELGSLDYLFTTLIREFKDKKYFSFGISNEQGGTKLNEGLNYWKESYGACGYVHRFFKLPTDNYTLLNDVLI